jgi:poly(3-hydroxybutyrate) depolymerase
MKSRPFDYSLRIGSLTPAIQSRTRPLKGPPQAWLALGIFLTGVGIGMGQPIITQQPQSCTNLAGSTAIFTVEATGTPPLAYHWQKLTANWSELAGRTNTALALTNVQTSDAADYRVAATNADGATTSAPAHLYVLVPPKITPTTNFQHQAVHVGSNALFAVTASGTAPLSYQWRLDGHDLTGQTNSTISFNPVQPADEGDYMVVITNVAGSVISAPARLWVVPPPSAFIRGDFTNGTYRIPYYYLMPTNYNPAHSYPLLCLYHGLCGDEITFTNAGSCNGSYWPGYANFAEMKVFASYRQQERDPAIVLWPTLIAGQSAPRGLFYLRQMTNLLADLTSRFNIDTNRVYVMGMSSGDVDGWDSIGLRPSFYAGWLLLAGWTGTTPARVIKDVPLWAFCAQNDEFGNLPGTQAAVRSLRLAGGNPLYTEYVTGGHEYSCMMALSTPAMVDWLLAQRRGVAPTNEPLLGITNPTRQAVLSTGATTLNLAGFAGALGQTVTKVAWENTSSNTKGNASGTNAWSVTGIPLRASSTNLIVVTGTTTSWAPAFGGNTTFNDTLTAIQSPLRATLTWQGTNAVLKWLGGGPPYDVQRATDLTSPAWQTIAGPMTNTTLFVTPTNTAAFYRIQSQ